MSTSHLTLKWVKKNVFFLHEIKPSKINLNEYNSAPRWRVVAVSAIWGRGHTLAKPVLMGRLRGHRGYSWRPFASSTRSINSTSLAMPCQTLSTPSRQGLTSGVDEVKETTSIGKWSPLDRPPRGTQTDLKFEKSVI